MSADQGLSEVERKRLIRILETDLSNRVRSVSQFSFTCDTKSLLREFGAWSRQGVNQGRVRSSIQIFVDMVSGSSSRSVAISDDMAMQINNALVALMRDDAEIANVLCLHYVSGLPEYLIAERLRFNRPKVRAMVSHGEGFVGGFLCQIMAA